MPEETVDLTEFGWDEEPETPPEPKPKRRRWPRPKPGAVQYMSIRPRALEEYIRVTGCEWDEGDARLRRSIRKALEHKAPMRRGSRSGWVLKMDRPGGTSTIVIHFSGTTVEWVGLRTYLGNPQRQKEG